MPILQVPALLCVVLSLLFGALALPSTASAQTPTEVLLDQQSRFNQLYSQGLYSEAVPVAEKISALTRAQFGESSSEYASSLYQVGNVLIGVSQNAEAEQWLRRALAIFSADPRYAAQQLQSQVMLATALINQSKFDEGVSMMQWSATAFEAAFGLADPRTVSALNNLAQTLQIIGRGTEAGPIYRKLISSLDPGNAANLTNLGILHGNLAAVLTQSGRRDEALSEMRRSVEFIEKIGNPGNRFLAVALSNLGKLEHDAGNHAAAEALYRRSLDSAERGVGAMSETYAGGLINLAVLQRDMGKPVEAEASTRRALTIFEKTLGASHPRTGSVMNGLAVLLSARGAWPEALALYERATEIAVRNARSIGTEDGRIADQIYGLNSADFPAHMRAIYHVAPNDPQRQAQAFELAQRSLNSRTAAAISRMAARAAAPGSELAKLIREQQDLLQARAMADQAIVAALGAKSDKDSFLRALADLAPVYNSLQVVDSRLKAEFPEYSALDGADPAPLAEIQRALGPREALVAFVEVASNPSIAGDTYAWVVTSNAVLWVRLGISDEFITSHAVALRCGLDAAAWRTPQGRSTCKQYTGVDRSEADEQAGAPLPYSPTRAHELYAGLFGPLEASLRMPDGTWRELLVVGSGSLAVIPLSALVTQPPAAAAGDTAATLRDIHWLARRQAITVLPAISSLAALRRVAKPSAATMPIIGFGNPLLEGSSPREQESAKESRARQSCANRPFLQRVAANLRFRSFIAPMETPNGRADVSQIRAAAPLPETADEICAVARELNGNMSEMRLGDRARESAIKDMSASGKLATFRVLHFATHGVLAGQLKGANEPGLVLTPPAVATERDDGYLSASEVASLKLDADWVILSACNTAGAEGGSGGTDALSGLARAFFYAGARALLVSHWEVDSRSTVKLITATVEAITKERKISRGEALRRSMVAMIDDGEPSHSHPTYWAAFIVVGDGGEVN